MAILMAGLVGSEAAMAAVPNIGGSAYQTDTILFDQGSVNLTLYSYVFQGPGDVLPEGMTPALSADEALFVYLIRNTGTTDADFLLLTNPDAIEVKTIGSANSILPAGYAPADRRNPDTYYTGWNPALGTDVVGCNWSSVPGYGLQLLHPDEWAAMIFRVDGVVDQVDADGGNSSTGILRSVPGPALPEPAVATLLIGVILFRLIRRR